MRKETIGNWLKLQRERIGRSVKEASLISGLSHTLLHKLEKAEDKRLLNASYTTLLKLVAGYELSLDRLLERMHDAARTRRRGRQKR